MLRPILATRPHGAADEDHGAGTRGTGSQAARRPVRRRHADARPGCLAVGGGDRAKWRAAPADTTSDIPATTSTGPPALVTASSDHCAVCGAQMAADQRYCLECGERRGQARFAAPTAAASTAVTLDAHRRRAAWLEMVSRSDADRRRRDAAAGAGDRRPDRPLGELVARRRRAPRRRSSRSMGAAASRPRRPRRARVRRPRRARAARRTRARAPTTSPPTPAPAPRRPRPPRRPRRPSRRFRRRR